MSEETGNDKPNLVQIVSSLLATELSSALKATPADDPKHEGIVSHWAMLVEEIEISVAQLERKPLPEGIRKGDIQKWSEENSRK